MKEGFSNIDEWLQARITDIDPISERNPKGFNPCLERWIEWHKRTLMNQKVHTFINKNFIVEHTLLRHAFKCSIEKVDNKSFLITQPKEALASEDLFCPPDTSYREMRKIMLTSKFQSLFEQRYNNWDVDKAKYD